jgi:hypothetical protein
VNYVNGRDTAEYGALDVGVVEDYFLPENEVSTQVRQHHLGPNRETLHGVRRLSPNPATPLAASVSRGERPSHSRGPTR